ADGFYEQGKCAQNYVRCAHGIAFAHSCPSNLVFSNEMCDYMQNCLNPTQPPAQQSPTLAPQQPLGAYGQQPQMPVQQAPPAPPVLPQQRGPYAQPQQPIQQSPPQPIENWCQQNSQQNGYHGEGCNSYYFNCNAGLTIRMLCPSGLFFDEETHACDHKEFIVACGGQKPTQPPAQSPTLAPQQPLSPYGQQPQMPIQQSPPQPIEDFCQRNNFVNGFHGEGCNNYFFVCSIGSTARIACPAGLWYDIDTQQCDHKEWIVACGGQKPTQPPAQSPTLAPQQPLSPYGQQPQMPIQQSPPAAPLFDCAGKADGIYVEGCNSQYFACNGGHAHTLLCPAGTFYSTASERCDYKEHVVECGGQTPTQAPIAQNPILLPQQPYGQFQQAPPMLPQTPSTPAPAWVAQPYQQSALVQQSPPVTQSTQPTQPTQIESVNTNPCLSLLNGIYGRKCSRFFFVCTNSKTYDFICPKDQAFNVKTSKCAPKNLISTCPEFTQIPQIPQVPQVPQAPQTQQSPPINQAVSPYGRRLY
ncbi:hypothetical protein FO519_009048, partial [Halicephalobus sp. NKZ332]